MIILIAVLGLVVVNAMRHSPWATSTVAATIPIALLIGLFMRHLRPGRVLEGTAIGVVLLLAAVFGGGWIDDQPTLRAWFDYDAPALALMVILYGFAAAVLPVWLLLAPRDYLSTFMKIGTIVALAIAIVILNPQVQMPALTQFIDGTGPIFGGNVFPFVFITIACGAISGFHSLIASGTTPKLLANERDARFIGYGGDGDGIVRRDHGDGRRLRARSRRLLRDQQPRRRRRRARPRTPSPRSRLGVIPSPSSRWPRWRRTWAKARCSRARAARRR